MKVMHLTYDMRIGGTEQVIKNLIMGNDGTINHSVLCIEQPLGPFAEKLHELGVEFVSLKRELGFDKKLIANIRKTIKTKGVDILHCHQYTPWVYGAIASFGTKTKVVFTEHGRFYPDSSSWKRKLVNPWLHRVTSATTAISVATKLALAEYENIPLSDIQLVYNGIHSLSVEDEKTELLKKELGIDDNELILGTIARLDPIKNHLMMLSAFSKIIATGVKAKLLIVGDGEMRTAIEKEVECRGLQEKVILTGYIASPEVHLGLMDIFLLSSLSEGASMTLLEAMSLSKPCVVTNAGGNPEIVKDGVTGFVTKNDDADAFARGITELLDPVKRRTLGENGRNSFIDCFSVTTMCKHYQNLYRQLNG